MSPQIQRTIQSKQNVFRKQQNVQRGISIAINESPRVVIIHTMWATPDIPVLLFFLQESPTILTTVTLDAGEQEATSPFIERRKGGKMDIVPSKIDEVKNFHERCPGTCFIDCMIETSHEEDVLVCCTCRAMIAFVFQCCPETIDQSHLDVYHSQPWNNPFCRTWV